MFIIRSQYYNNSQLYLNPGKKLHTSSRIVRIEMARIQMRPCVYTIPSAVNLSWTMAIHQHIFCKGHFTKLPGAQFYMYVIVVRPVQKSILLRLDSADKQTLYSQTRAHNIYIYIYIYLSYIYDVFTLEQFPTATNCFPSPSARANSFSRGLLFFFFFFYTV